MLTLKSVLTNAINCIYLQNMIKKLRKKNVLNTQKNIFIRYINVNIY